MSKEIIGGFAFTGNYALPPHEYTKRKDDLKYLVVHCSATKAHHDIDCDDIREWHVKDNGWSDCGYHWVIKRDGTIERGRPVWAIGAGVAGYNSHSLHICLVGGIDNDGNPEDNFRPIQKSALAFLLSALQKYVAPRAQVCGHRDFPKVKKACPSFDAKAWWKGVQSGPAIPTTHGQAFQQYVFGATYLN